MKKIILAMLLLLFSSTFSFAAEGIEYDIEFWLTTGSDIKASWDEVSDADYYRVRLYHMELKRYLKAFTTEDTKYIIKTDRTGHFTLEVQACKFSLTSESLCSEWATSLTHGINKDVKGPWVIYSRPAPVGTLTIE
jgi:hypothetical protein